MRKREIERERDREREDTREQESDVRILSTAEQGNAAQVVDDDRT